MKIISGGQTGVDQGALEGARQAGIETGGYAPKGYLTENGHNLTLQNFHLIDSGMNYKGRTELNARNSDVTIWIGKKDTVGYVATKRACIHHTKPFIHFIGVDSIVKIIIIRKWNILNFAGSRESKSSGIQKEARQIVYDICMKLKTWNTSLEEF